MSRTQLQSLIHMANEIAANLAPGAPDEAEAAARVASHLRRFWARSMKQTIVQYAQEDGSELSPVAKAAVASL